MNIFFKLKMLLMDIFSKLKMLLMDEFLKLKMLLMDPRPRTSKPIPNSKYIKKVSIILMQRSVRTHLLCSNSEIRRIFRLKETMEKSTYVLLLPLLIIQLQRSFCVAERERTLAIVKPDGMMGNHSEEIKNIVLAEGYVIATHKLLQLDQAAVRNFYAEHSQRDFFPSLIKFMTSGPVLAMILEKEDAVAQWRALIGPTDARKARISHPQSIRALCGLDSEKNCIHGSDSLQSAAREIAFFFGHDKSGEVILGHDEL